MMYVVLNYLTVTILTLIWGLWSPRLSCSVLRSPGICCASLGSSVVACGCLCWPLVGRWFWKFKVWWLSLGLTRAGVSWIWIVQVSISCHRWPHDAVCPLRSYQLLHETQLTQSECATLVLRWTDGRVHLVNCARLSVWQVDIRSSVSFTENI